MTEKLGVPRNSVEQKGSREKIFAERLLSVVHTNVSVENINEYTDDALELLIQLTEDVTTAYKESATHLEPLSDNALEDAAYSHYHLSGIGDVLNRVQDIAQSINRIEQQIQKSKPKLDKIYHLPPTSQLLRTGSGEGEIIPPGIVRRLKMLLFLLEADCEIPADQIDPDPGDVDENWYRREPYFRVPIPDLERLVYVCEEERNATYVFDTNLLSLLNISDKLLDHASKEDLNAFIDELPGIGIRVVQQASWRQIMVGYLTEPLPPLEVGSNESMSNLDSSAELFEVSADDLDPWKGFYTDKDGKHWGTVRSIALKAGLRDQGRIANDFIERGLPTKEIVSARRARTGYCYEDVLEVPKVATLTSSVQAIEKPGWEGFHTDEEGNHWSSISAICDRLDIPWSAGSAFLESYMLQMLTLRVKKTFTAYRFEDVAALAESTGLLQIKRVQESGEWEGYYIDELGRHWGTSESINERTGLGDTRIKALAQGHKIRIRSSGRGSSPIDGYCLEDIEATPTARVWREVSPVTSNGEWEDYFTDVEKKHWATLRTISQRLSISLEALTKEVDGQLEMKQILTNNNDLDNGYCLEEILKIPEVIKWESTPRVANEGIWAGFYTDSDNNHWSSSAQTLLRLGYTVQPYAEDLLENSTKQRKEIIAGPYIVNGYCFEEASQVPQLKQWSEAGALNGSGEWAGYHVDTMKLHWGSAKKISVTLGLTQYNLKNILDKHPELEKKPLRLPGNGEDKKGYCLEVISQLPEYVEWKNVPEVAKDGEWKGFYTTPDGRHIGSVITVAAKVPWNPPISDPLRKISKAADQITISKVRGEHGVVAGYCLEEVDEKLNRRA